MATTDEIRARILAGCPPLTPSQALLKAPALVSEDEAKKWGRMIAAAQANNYPNLIDAVNRVLPPTGYAPGPSVVSNPAPTFIEQLKTNIKAVEKQLVVEAEAKSKALAEAAEPGSDADGVYVVDAPDGYQTVAYVDLLSSLDDDAPSAPSPDPLGQVGLEKLVRFDESDIDENNNPTFAIAVAVWIQGTNISEYIKGTINIQKNGVQGHNTATITLDNQDDRFIWSERNLARKLGRDFYFHNGRRYTVEPGKEFAGDHESIKKQVFKQKGDPIINPPIITPRNTMVFPRYDLTPNRCIFSRMDPIRIWSLYPFRPQGQLDADNRELWIPEFTGFVEHVSVEEDDVRGTSTITLECSCSRQMVLQKMRISADPMLGMANSLDLLGFPPEGVYHGEGQGGGPEHPSLTAARAAFAEAGGRFFNQNTTQFYDDIVNSHYGQLFPDLNFEESIKALLVFHPERIRSGAAGRGVRNIRLGGTFSYDSVDWDKRAARSFLEEYHRFCLFGPKRRPWSRKEVEAVGGATTTYSKNSDNEVAFSRYYPMNCRLWFLLPKEGTGPKTISDLGNIGVSPQHAVNWTTRLEVLRNFVESLDYQICVSGTGDYHVEFPMADFRPEDFGDFKNVLRFNRAKISSGFGDEQQDPLTGVAVTIGLGKGVGVDSQAAPVAEALQKVYAYSPFIAARYGIVTDSIAIPFLRITDGDKPIAQQRAAIHMQKANARCHTLTLATSYRPFLLPNRPVHHVRRSRIGSVVTLDTAFDIGSQPKASVSVGCEHIRSWTGWYRNAADLDLIAQAQKDEWKAGGVDLSKILSIDDVSDSVQGDLMSDPVSLQVYHTVMGGESVPTSARLGWGSSAVHAPGSGIYVLDPQELMNRQLLEMAKAMPAPAHEPANAAAAPAVSVPESLAPKTDPDTVFSHDPLGYMHVTSGFAMRQDPGGVNGVAMHNGLDLRAAVGTTVYAVAEGKITSNPNSATSGKHIDLHVKGGAYRVGYAHLSEITVSTGDVKAGQAIGKSGATGKMSNGKPPPPHLHVQVKDLKAGTWVDPLPLLPSGK